MSQSDKPGKSGANDQENLDRADELLQTARQLQRQVELTTPPASKSDTAQKTGKESPRAARDLVRKGAQSLEALQAVNENLSYFRRLLRDIKETYLGLHERYFWPVSAVLGPPLRWLIRRYRALWQRYAFYTDSETGERVLSRKRSSLLIGLTILFLAAFTPTWLGEAVRFVTLEPLSDGMFMAMSKKTEVFYLNNSEEVDPLRNEHAVRGCRSGGQCTERDAVYFRVKPRLSHDIWKLFTHGNPIYVPDHVIAPIAPGVNRCAVTYYGYRMTTSWTSRLLRSLELCPTMLEADCTAVTADIIEGQKPIQPKKFRPSRKVIRGESMDKPAAD